jgi:hypothetical protein
LYEEDCFINNPYRVEEGLSEEDCDSKCKDLKEIDTLREANHKVISEFLFNETPVVIKDATEDWSAMKDFNIEFLAEVRTCMTLLSVEITKKHSKNM